MNKNTMIVVLLFVIISLAILYLYFNSSIFFSKEYSDKIKFYFSTENCKKIPVNITIGNKTSSSWSYDQKYTLENIGFYFKGSAINNFQRIEFWDMKYKEDNINKTNFYEPIGEGEYKLNMTKLASYRNTHVPDLFVKASFFDTPEHMAPIWTEANPSTPFIPVKNLFKRIGYAKWRTDILFDNSFVGYQLKDKNLFGEYELERLNPAQKIDQITLIFRVKKGLQIEGEDFKKYSSQYGDMEIKIQLNPNEEISISLTDPSKENHIAIFNVIFTILIAIIIGILIKYVFL